MKKLNKQFKLDEIANYMDSLELGHEPTIEEMDNIGEYIEELKRDTQEEE